MITSSLRFMFLAALVVLSASPVRAQTVSKIEPLGDNTYTLTVGATNKFTRNTEKLKAAGIEAATAFCAREGRVFKLVSAAEKKSMYLVGDMAATTITFKALASGDPELAASYPIPSTQPVSTSATDALYSDLLKLDELRKKGLLTDAEFEVEKKKVLNRSQ
jgi:hypothetical protein